MKLKVDRTLFPVIALFILTGLMLSCKPSNEDVLASFAVKNTSSVEFKDAVLEISDTAIINSIADASDKFLIVAEDVKLPWQLIKNKSGSIDRLLVQCSVGSEQELQIKVVSSESVVQYPKKTQAELSIRDGGDWVEVVKKNGNEQYEYQGGAFKNIDYLRVPDKHTDHSFYIRYEGPGWESDKVAYRFYLDWRNAVDIFGKKVPENVLQDVGQDGFDSYHEEQAWGMDVLKVGSSLGIGSIGYWDGEKANRVANTDSIICKIVENGTLYSKIKTKYYGWKDATQPTNLKSLISIKAGSRLTKQKLICDSPIDNICTGIVKHDSASLLSNSEGKWGYIATFGRQSLNDDMLGMFVFYKTNNLSVITEDDHSHIIVLKPSNNKVEYLFGATWELDSDHIATKEMFESYLDKTLKKLNTPLKVK